MDYKNRVLEDLQTVRVNLRRMCGECSLDDAVIEACQNMVDSIKILIENVTLFQGK